MDRIWSGPWIDYPDTFLHIGISAVLTFLVHGMVTSRGGSWWSAARWGVLVAFTVGLGRELFNLWQSLSMPWMFFSMKDMAWNFVGIALGLLLVLESGKQRPPRRPGGKPGRRRRTAANVRGRRVPVRREGGG